MPVSPQPHWSSNRTLWMAIVVFVCGVLVGRRAFAGADDSQQCPSSVAGGHVLREGPKSVEQPASKVSTAPSASPTSSISPTPTPSSTTTASASIVPNACAESSKHLSGISAWDMFTCDGTFVVPPRRADSCRPRKAGRQLHGADAVEAVSPNSNSYDVRQLAASASGAESCTVGCVHGQGGGAPRPCVVGPYHSDFAHIVARLKDVDGPGFAFVRYADGELGVAQGREIGNAEWHVGATVGGQSQLQTDLLASMRGHWGQDYFYGFASPANDIHGLKWFLQRTEQSCEFISYANIWVNSHYTSTKDLFVDLTQNTYRGKVILVVNQESVDKVKDAGWMADALPLPDNIPPMWEQPTWRSDIIARAEALARKYDGHLIIVSGGPPGKVLAAKMWEANCRNKIVDMGSTMDPILRGKKTRVYHEDGTPDKTQVDPLWYVPPGEDPLPTAI